jgi:RNA polymerase sigma-70 factor (ECF subfamily)
VPGAWRAQSRDRAEASDVALVLAARAGDKAALARLLTRHHRLVTAVCRRALGEVTLAEDAFQEAAIQALLGLEHLRHPAQFGPWLAGIALNICRSWRRVLVREERSWAALWDRQARNPGWDADPSALAELAEQRDWVRHAVAALPTGQRAAVTLYYLSGLSQEEAARALGIAAGAVKGRLHKARATLRRELSTQKKEAIMSASIEQPLVEVEVMTIRHRLNADPATVPHVVVLEERGGTRRLPLFIGASECRAMARTLMQSPLPVPPPYALTTALLTALGGSVREVRLTHLVDAIVYATVVLAGPGGAQEVESRPSDALNLALLAAAPIRVAPAIFEAVEAALVADLPGPQQDLDWGADNSAEGLAILDGTWRQWLRTDS